MKKRLISLILAIVMVLTAVPVTFIISFAEEITSEPAISAEDAYCKPGESVSVSLTVSDNPGIAGGAITVTFPEELTLTNAENGDVFENESDYTAPNELTSPCVFTWDMIDGVTQANGTLVTLTFTLPEEAECYTQYPISLSYRKGDFFNEEAGAAGNVDFTLENGMIEALDFIPGDVNDDGSVNGKDTRLIRQFNSSGYNVSINEFAADVNDDNAINGKDVRLLRRVIAGGYGEKFIPHHPVCSHDNMTEIAYKAATCTENGNTGYWYCSNCDKYFSDADGENEITLEDTVIKAKGHTIVIDEAREATLDEPGLTEGSHCSVCNEIIKKQEPVTAEEFLIKYDIANSDEYLESLNIINPNPQKGIIGKEYSVNEVPYVEGSDKVPGYRFLGWYDLPGGSEAKQITTVNKSITLYAHWERIQYTITYNCGFDGKNNSLNKLTYTVEDNVKLYDAAYAGYRFDCWIDEDTIDEQGKGDVITSIPAGTIGDIHLQAKWKSDTYNAKSYQDITNPKYDRFTLINEGHEYYFVYYLGFIDDVVFDMSNNYIKNTGLSDLEFTNSITTEETISKTITDTTQETDNWQKKFSISSSSSSGGSAEVSIGALKIGGQRSFSLSGGFEKTWGHTTTKTHGESTTETSSLAKEYGSKVTIPKESPRGYYTTAITGSLDVWAIIRYNAKDNIIDMGTFSEVGSSINTNAWIYSAESSQFTDVVPNCKLDFNPPMDDIRNEILNIKKQYISDFDMESVDEFDLFVEKYSKYNWVSTINDLNCIREEPNANYVITNDINLNGYEWIPVESFSGILDGNNHLIENVSINVTQLKSGFILNNYGVLKNIVFDNIVLNANHKENTSSERIMYAGGIVEKNNDSAILQNIIVSNSLIQAFLQQDDANDNKPNMRLYLGGIVGINEGIVKDTRIISSTIKSYCNGGNNVTDPVVAYCGGVICQNNASGKATSVQAENCNVSAEARGGYGAIFSGNDGKVRTYCAGIICKNYGYCMIEYMPIGNTIVSKATGLTTDMTEVKEYKDDIIASNDGGITISNLNTDDLTSGLVTSFSVGKFSDTYNMVELTTATKKYQLVVYPNCSWTLAQQIAVDNGGKLISVNSETEQKIADKLIATTQHTNYWIGMQMLDWGDVSYYRWEDGTILAYSSGNWFITDAVGSMNNLGTPYTYWYSDQPDYTGKTERYIGTLRSEGKWNDYCDNADKTNDHIYGFIIEYDLDGDISKS